MSMINEAVKGQDTASRREGAKERAAEKKSGKIRKNTLDPKEYATQQKKSIEWHDKRTKGRYIPGQISDVNEVAPPGWGHTKAEKEKTKPNKPKSKIGGTAAAFKRALDDGRFKGLPGSKTKKEKTADMFKLMWSMKKKGDKPHYKPGTDEKYKKYQEEMTYQEAIDAGWEMTADGFWWPPQNIDEKLSTKDAKKLNKASALSQSEDPKDQDRARARQTEVDYKSLLDQRKKGKVSVGSSMKEGVVGSYSGSGQVSFSQFYDRAKEARAQKERERKRDDESRAQSQRTREDSAKHGIQFSDAKGTGRIRGGKKIYDK